MQVPAPALAHLLGGQRAQQGRHDGVPRPGARYPWLSLVSAVSDDPGFGGEQGNISDIVGKSGPWQEHDSFVSGSPAMVKATLRRLAELQVPSLRIKYDVFGDQ